MNDQDAKVFVDGLSKVLVDISEGAVRQGIKLAFQKEKLNIENSISIKLYICPVCQGKTIVPAGFYNWPSGYGGSVTSTCAEPCSACSGNGYILL